jgi:hypothetical protein
MKLRFVLGSAPLLATVLMAATAAHADTFDVRSNAAHGHRSDVPQRGMTMAQVEQAYGAPVDKLPTAGGDAPRHPPINRWRYNGYTVYFERNRVIHSVVDTASEPPST